MSKRILIIDDEQHIRRMMHLTLETTGYEVAEATDGAEGLKLFGDGSKWAAVVLDQRMPGIDGLETLRQLRKLNPNARVIVATAYASIELAVDAMKLGATDFVRKPMTPEILRDAVAAAIAKPRAAAPKPTADQDDSAKPAASLIHILTMNGFEIVRLTELSDSEPAEPRERHFMVKNPRGWEREAIVEIPEEVVAYAERMTHRQLPPESSFWTARAERALATYLWNEGRFPAHRLSLVDLSPEEVDVAVRWGRDEP
ncbi:MAG TPA: response regulator [Pyrinomonadaceae bacterium]|nr:response regulator [Pyrinomonadaceae bacterium]